MKKRVKIDQSKADNETKHFNPTLKELDYRVLDDRVRETAAKLALQSSDGHYDTRTGRRLKRFGEKMSKKVATNEFERNKGLDQTMDPKRLWKSAIDLRDKGFAVKFSSTQLEGKNLKDAEITIETYIEEPVRQLSFSTD